MMAKLRIQSRFREPSRGRKGVIVAPTIASFVALLLGSISRSHLQTAPTLWFGRLSRGVVFALALLLCGGISHAESEAAVKAAYLFNFAKLVEWPAGSFASARAPLVIGIVGRDAVGDELVRGCVGATAGGHPVQVRRISAAEVRECQVVYVPEAERADLIIEAARGVPVLVVGEVENFARRGGAIGFVKEGDLVKFEVNPKAAARNGLAVSAKLLRVARGVVDR